MTLSALQERHFTLTTLCVDITTACPDTDVTRSRISLSMAGWPNPPAKKTGEWSALSSRGASLAAAPADVVGA